MKRIFFIVTSVILLASCKSNTTEQKMEQTNNRPEIETTRVEWNGSSK